MRRGLTLIELIFTMVIVAIVFTVVPKMIFAFNQSARTTVKEDALYNAFALMGAIVNLPWDAQNVDHDDILHTDETAFGCDASTYSRIGGFGSRLCPNALDATADLGREDDAYDDLDDYEGFETNASSACRVKYTLGARVLYIADPAAPSESSVTVDLDGLGGVDHTSDLKEVQVSVRYAPGNRKGGFCKTIYYDSANLGLVSVKGIHN